MNKSFRISPSKVLSRALINTVYHLLVKNKKGRGGMLKREMGGGGLIKFLPLNRRGGGLIYHLRENRGFTVVNDAQVIRRQIATSAAGHFIPGDEVESFH